MHYNTGIMNKSKRKHNRRNINKKELHLRGAIRSGPICWFISDCQLLNYIQWPQYFQNYAKHNTNVFAKIIGFITDLTGHTKTKYQPINGQIGENIAQNVVTYVNSKRDARLDSVRLWHIKQQQDAQEFLTYFFDMIMDLNNSNIIPAVLQTTSKTTQTQIKKMQDFIRETFVFETTEELICGSNIRLGSKEKSFMLNIKVPEKEEQISLQELCDMHLAGEATEIRQEVDCGHCHQHHDTDCALKLTELDNEYILLHLVRFKTGGRFETYIEDKINTPVLIDAVIILKCNTRYEIFESVAVVNHVDSNETNHGHYNTDKYFNGLNLHNCDDHKIKDRVREFNAQSSYIVMLKRYRGRRQDNIIEKYLNNLQIWKEDRQREKKRKNDHHNQNNIQPPRKKRKKKKKKNKKRNRNIAVIPCPIRPKKIRKK